MIMENAFKKEVGLNVSACRTFAVASFIILTALGAFVRIPLPFTPVPLTLQTFFVLLSGAFLGSGLGAFSQLGYIFLGVAGLPVFTNAGSGLIYLAGPTAGYLFGFVISVLFLGRFKEHAQDNPYSLFAVFCIADLIILFSGILWLKFLFGYSFQKLLLLGVLPFIPGDILKVMLALGVYRKLNRRAREILSVDKAGKLC